MGKPKLYGTAEAAAYLKVHERTFRYHLTKGHLEPDYTIGGDFAFAQATLDAFRATHQSEGLTMEEAAEMLGVDRSWIRNRHLAGQLTASGKRGKFWVFSPESIEALRPLAEARAGSRPQRREAELGADDDQRK